jgi:hypothetical protein
MKDFIPLETDPVQHHPQNRRNIAIPSFKDRRHFKRFVRMIIFRIASLILTLISPLGFVWPRQLWSHLAVKLVTASWAPLFIFGTSGLTAAYAQLICLVLALAAPDCQVEE